jgi:transglutaminase-like putative cysteine protease
LFFCEEKMLTKIRIHHRTTYRYTAPVNPGPHRLMLRPRESRELRLLSTEITVVPDVELTWALDVSGNAIATATFASLVDTLVIDAVSELQLSSKAWPIFPIAASAINYPFLYADDEWTDLGALAIQQYEDRDGKVRAWVKGFAGNNPIDTLTLLKNISAGIHDRSQYESREVEGTQTPKQTLDQCRGSCRDFAVLFVEAVRLLGFGARIVSGYLYNRDTSSIGSADSGSTHAWAEVYLPGAGWITFDPTNLSVGGFNLIPVAVARDIKQTIPIAGSFAGPNDAMSSMDVTVDVVGI